MLDLEPATRTLTRLVEGVSDDELDAPTSCADTSLAALIDHVDGLATAFTDAARRNVGDGAPSADGSRSGADWRPHGDG
jgi:Mycothiol maleylpyruvate isomerase N-terminal domain